MKHVASKITAMLLCAAMLCGWFLVQPPKAQAAHYTGYETVAVVKNQGDCYSMQGCDSDDTYIYCSKVNTETETSAVIARVHKDTGAVTYLTNSATGTYYFSQLAHANDLDVVDIDGVKTIFVATGTAGKGPYSLVRLALSGTTLTEVAHYNMQYNNADQRISGAQVMSIEGDNINMLCLWSNTIYTATIGVDQATSKVTMTKLFSMDFTDITINGVKKDLSAYVKQGFEYYDGKIYLPLDGNSDYSVSTITAWDVIGASGTIKNDPNFSVWSDDTTFVDLSEIESCTICPSDGRMYFSTNRRKTSSDANWDGVHYISGFVYDPSVGDRNQPTNYRWNIDGNLYSSNQEGAEFNYPQIIRGTVTSTNLLTESQYSLDQTVVLKHDIPWILEWKASGVKNAMLMSTTRKSGVTGNQYLYVRKDGLVSIGTYDGSNYNNYGINITDHGLSPSDSHAYRLENRIADDGSNMVYLYVDNKLLGTMNQHFVGGTNQGSTSNWISGKDFKFSYLGTNQHPISGKYSHLKVWGNGKPGKMDEPNAIRWETDGNALSPVTKFGHTPITVSKLSGSISGTDYTDYQAALSSNATLLHTKPWSLEWSGSFDGMLFASAPYARTERASFLYQSAIIALGRWDGTAFQNYGVRPSDYGIDVNQSHTYRLTNRINDDGSNMIYLYVDGQEIAPMDTHFTNSTEESTGSDWVSGKDFSFSHLGTYQFRLTGTLSNVQVWEYGLPAEQTAKQYYWTPGTNTMTSDTQSPYTQNSTVILGGSNSGSTMNNAWYRISDSIVLLHDRSWSIQWQSSGSWSGAANGSFLLSASQFSNEVNAPYLYRRSNSTFIALGTRLDGLHKNYGVSLSDHGIDGTVKHTYELVNKPNADGSNMVYLYVDGKEIAPMNTYFEGGVNTGITSHWVSGKDFVFSYIGTPRFPLGSCDLSYLKISEGCTHSYGSWTVTAHATCVNTGIRSRSCTLCGETQTEAVPVIDHSYKAQVTAPSCTTGGYTTYTCTVCGDTYQADQTEPKGHSYKTTVIDATCTNGGYTTYRCSICGDTYQSNFTEAAGHDYTAAVTAPTCTAQGYTTYTCKLCGSSKVEDYTNATGHRYASKVTAPTCTTGGYTIYTCSDCGHSYQDHLTNPTGHAHSTTVVAPTCISGGYTVYTCACGDQYTADRVSATGHSFVDGVCTACGEADPDYVKPVVIPTLALKAPTLEFKDMITVNAMFTAENIEDVVEMGMITYTEKVDEWNVETAAHVIPGTTYDVNTGRYIAASQGIHAKYLGDTVYLACYAKLTNGSYVYTKLAPYSPVQYATNQISKSTDTKLKQLCAAMLNYGAEAQLFFGHNVDNLANATLTDEQKSLPAAYDASMTGSVPAASAEKQGAFANNKGFSKRTPSISFEGAFCINYFFTPAYAPVDGITMYYWTAADYEANEVLTPENASGSFQMEGEGVGQYRGDITGIAAKALSEAVYVAAVYSDGTTTWTSGVLGYSIGSYCASQISKGAAIAALAEATAVYGYHAKAYFG